MLTQYKNINCTSECFVLPTSDTDSEIDSANSIKNKILSNILLFDKIIEALLAEPEEFPANGEEMLNDFSNFYTACQHELAELKDSKLAKYMSTVLENYEDCLSDLIETIEDVRRYHVTYKDPESEIHKLMLLAASM